MWNLIKAFGATAGTLAFISNIALQPADAELTWMGYAPLFLPAMWAMSLFRKRASDAKTGEIWDKYETTGKKKKSSYNFD